jgi:hypothetical protein
MNPQNKNIVLYLLLLYLGLFAAGILCAYWIGMAWFFLFHTISILLASSPRLYLPVWSLLMGKDFTEGLKERLSISNKQWFVSKSAMALNLFDILLTLLAFWKINVPFRTILLAIISAK